MRTIKEMYKIERKIIWQVMKKDSSRWSDSFWFRSQLFELIGIEQSGAHNFVVSGRI